MVYRTKYGLGPQDSAVSEFNKLSPFVRRLRELQTLCEHMGSDDLALKISVDGLEVAAFHFTRRPHFYFEVRVERERGRNYFPALGTPEEAMEVFKEFRPYNRALSHLMQMCKPFGRDYMALMIASQALDTTVYHFTQIGGFYGIGDAAGPSRPPRGLG